MRRWLVAMSALFVSACDCCVARGAKVKTPRGPRNIEDLGVGDEVIVVDPETLEPHVSVITDVRSSMRECGRLHFGAASLTVTSSHPVYDPRAKEWAPAGDWLLGVRTEFLGENGPLRVTQAERFVGVEEVFDLSVAHDLHTFVADSVVVHNKPPSIASCAPTTDGATHTPDSRCECGPLKAPEVGRVTCDGPDGTPSCDCGWGESGTWAAALGTSEQSLLDGTWWTRVDRVGPSSVLGVEALVVDQSAQQLPVLPGTPNVLNIFERGDGSEGFLTRVFVGGEQARSGSVWFFKDGVFPRALTLGDGHLVLLGVDEEFVWFQPAFDANGASTSERWVMRGLPSRTWLNLSWNLTPVSDSTYRFYARVKGADGFYSEAFQAEVSGDVLWAFSADGGTFSFGDAGIPRELVLGHRSGADGGGGVLRVTGVSVTSW